MEINSTEQAPLSRREMRSLRDYLGLTLRGVAMGASDIVPGVSGGTMAFILGIYEELIDSIRTFGRRNFLQAALRLRVKDVLAIVNWPFLLAVGLGIGLAVLTLAGGLEWVLQNQPVFLWSFFFGLILGSVITVSRRIGHWKLTVVIALAAAALGAYLLVGAVPAQTPDNWWFLILCGALASCAMILPGLSGAFILVLLGKYEFVLSAVNQRDVVSLAFVAIGAAIGLITLSQILGYFFKRYHDLTVAVLIGFMLGSLRKVWPWKIDVAWLTDINGEFVLSHGERIVSQQRNVLPDLSTSAGVTEFLLAVVLALIGFGLVMIVDRMANRREKDAPQAQTVSAGEG